MGHLLCAGFFSDYDLLLFPPPPYSPGKLQFTLQPPRPAEDLTDDGGVPRGMARRLGCTQAPLLHGIQSEHQKLVGILLLQSMGFSRQES